MNRKLAIAILSVSLLGGLVVGYLGGRNGEVSAVGGEGRTAGATNSLPPANNAVAAATSAKLAERKRVAQQRAAELEAGIRSGVTTRSFSCFEAWDRSSFPRPWLSSTGKVGR